MHPALPYRRTQRAPLFAALALVLCLWIVVVAVWIEWHPLLLLPLVVLLYVSFAFSSLTVEVVPGEARLRFGLIGPRRRIPLAGVRSVEPVRNSWLTGFGIRWYPGGWMWNIWGLGAVELAFEGRRSTFRIGTDRPGELAAALQRARPKGGDQGKR